MFYNPFLIPRFHHDLDEPPTLYSLMQSIVNYDKPDKTKIRDLAKNARETIFDFDYPLSEKVDKEKFEIQILNRFIMRRIGTDTFTAFQINLMNKLNEIMPKYNILFNSLDNWNLFRDGMLTEKIGHTEDSKNELGTTTSETSVNSNVNSETKMRHSDLPQSELQDIDDESYVNIYEKNNGINNSSSSSTNNTNDKRNEDSKNDYTETIKQSQSDLVEKYIIFQNEVQNIYTLLYQDLDCLFYQIY